MLKTMENLCKSDSFLFSTTRHIETTTVVSTLACALLPFSPPFHIEFKHAAEKKSISVCTESVDGARVNFQVIDSSPYHRRDGAKYLFDYGRRIS